MVKIYCPEEDTFGMQPWNIATSSYERKVSKTEYDLLLLQVSELRKRIDEVEERERTLIKMLMEKLNGADD